MNASLNEKLRAVKWGEYKLGTLFDIENTLCSSLIITLCTHFFLIDLLCIYNIIIYYHICTITL